MLNTHPLRRVTLCDSANISLSLQKSPRPLVRHLTASLVFSSYLLLPRHPFLSFRGASHAPFGEILPGLFFHYLPQPITMTDFVQLRNGRKPCENQAR